MFLLRRRNQQKGDDPDWEELNDEESPLPPGWAALKDPDSAKMYYANSHNGETTWERPGPTHNSMPQHQQEGSKVPVVSRPQLPQTQAQLQSQVSAQAQTQELNKRTYSYSTRAAVAPHPIPASGNGSVSSPLQPKWASFTDQASGKMYYRNLSTGEMRWEKTGDDTISEQVDVHGSRFQISSPTQADDSQLQTSLPSSPTQANASLLQVGWKSLMDPASGKPYYKNMSSGEMRWEKPSLAPSSTNKESPLPPGWAALKDGASGKTCYANASTGELSWEKPVFAIKSASPSQSSLALGETYDDHPDTTFDESDDSNTDDDSDEFEHDGNNWVRKKGWVIPPIIARNHSYLWLCCDMRCVYRGVFCN